MLRQGDTACMSEAGWADARRIVFFCGYCLMWCCLYASAIACIVLAILVIGVIEAAAKDGRIFNQTATRP